MRIDINLKKKISQILILFVWKIYFPIITKLSRRDKYIEGEDNLKELSNREIINYFKKLLRRKKKYDLQIKFGNKFLHFAKILG